MGGDNSRDRLIRERRRGYRKRKLRSLALSSTSNPGLSSRSKKPSISPLTIPETEFVRKSVRGHGGTQGKFGPADGFEAKLTPFEGPLGIEGPARRRKRTGPTGREDAPTLLEGEKKNRRGEGRGEKAGKKKKGGNKGARRCGSPAILRRNIPPSRSRGRISRHRDRSSRQTRKISIVAAALEEARARWWVWRRSGRRDQKRLDFRARGLEGSRQETRRREAGIGRSRPEPAHGR